MKATRRGFLASMSFPAWASVFPAEVSDNEFARLMEATAFVRGLDRDSLAKLVPERSGLHFVGCANCAAGRQESQLSWTPERPDEIFCQYCAHRYPSSRFPMNKTLAVRNPRGEVQQYPYWENAQGYRYFFQARRDDEVREYLAGRARALARLYAATRKPEYASGAAAVLVRFAQVFPGWCYHYDYPFRQKEIYSGDVPPGRFRPGFRTARWNWWAYMDIPYVLVEAYDWIRDSGALDDAAKAAIERDLFRSTAEQVMANPETYSNMSPTLWRSLILVGRVLPDSKFIEEPLQRMRHQVATQFFYDGFWYEGSPSYHKQEVGGLYNVLKLLRGYRDVESDFPQLARARAALLKLRLPDGRAVPVHDTWHFDKSGEPLAETQPFLLPGLGHACLGGGAGSAQMQLHLTWSGAYGHQHADNLSLILYAHGREMLSDIGYTHTRQRAWTLATVAHNTVVIDGESQELRFDRNAPYTDGNLRYLDTSDRRVQVVSVDGERGYPKKASVYRRTLILVDAGADRRYVLDLFDVEGGQTHDYFLHGDADTPGGVTTDLKQEPLATLLPAGFRFKPGRNEGEANRAAEKDFAYGYLTDLQVGSVPSGKPLPVSFRVGGVGLRATLLPEAGSRLITGFNPAVRGANEDDAKLDGCKRPFLLLRHVAAGGRSRFAAILEPHGGAPFLSSVEWLKDSGGGLALRVRFGDRTDLLIWNASEKISAPMISGEATFRGDIGVLSLRGDTVEHAYALGTGGWDYGNFHLAGKTSKSVPLRAVEGEALVAAGSVPDLPAAGQVVRLITTDGWVYPYTVVAAERSNDAIRIRVAEGPGLVFDAARQQVRLTAYPQREHAGTPQVEWIA